MQTKIEEPHTLMRVDEVAALLGQCRETVYRKIQAGQIPALRLGGGRCALRVDSAALSAWLESAGQR